MENTSYGDAGQAGELGGAFGGDRGRASAREVPRLAEHGDSNQNVNSAERILSLAGGAALALYGAKRRDWIGGALALLGAGLVERGATGHCAVYGALGVNTADGDHGLERKHGPAATVDAKKAIRIERAMSIDVPAAELYRFWRNFENLPRFMEHLERVRTTGDRRSHWVAKGPAGTQVEWDAEITADVPDERIEWRSTSGDVENHGAVYFRPSTGRGTEVLVDLSYKAPGGRLGALVAKLFREEPGQQVAQDLAQFKQVMEVGEVLLSNSTVRSGPHAAKPHATDAKSPKVRANLGDVGSARMAAEASVGSNR